MKKITCKISLEELQNSERKLVLENEESEIMRSIVPKTHCYSFDDESTPELLKADDAFPEHVSYLTGTIHTLTSSEELFLGLNIKHTPSIVRKPMQSLFKPVTPDKGRIK